MFKRISNSRKIKLLLDRIYNLEKELWLQKNPFKFNLMDCVYSANEMTNYFSQDGVLSGRKYNKGTIIEIEVLDVSKREIHDFMKPLFFTRYKVIFQSDSGDYYYFYSGDDLRIWNDNINQ